MRDSISALVLGLRIDQRALIEAAGRVGDRGIACLYYRMARAKERYDEELAWFASHAATGDGSRFITQLRDLVAELKTSLNDEESYAALGDTVRVEDAVLDQYKRAIFHASETPVSRLLKRQYVELCDSRNQLAELRDRYIPVDLRTSGN